MGPWLPPGFDPLLFWIVMCLLPWIAAALLLLSATAFTLSIGLAFGVHKEIARIFRGTP